MKSFLKYMLATIAGILILNFLGVIIFIIIIGAAAGSDEPNVDDNSILLAKFSSPVMDRSGDNPFSQFASGRFNMDGTMGLDQILDDIEKAKGDERIKGIFLDLSSVPIALAHVQEIRDKLMEFKESDKFILAHADMYTQKSYYLASVADKIYLTPTGELEFKGLSASVMYFREALDKIGVEVQVVRHGEYKSAVEPFLDNEMSEENREQLNEMISDIWDQMITDISIARDIPIEDLKSYAEGLSVTFDSDALENRMVDGLKYYDEVLDELRELTETDEDDDIPAITLKKYARVSVDNDQEATSNRIAVIFASGTIVMGNAGEGYIGADRIAKAIRKARKDDKVKAIVLRVNSGGGGTLASEIVYREAELAAKEKPVVASMGPYAASGGYYIVCQADTILASETTLTGSIGVFGLLPNVQEMMNEKLGINTETVKTNKYADIASPMRPLTADERTIIQHYVDDFYETFITNVADGRGMSKEEVDALGGGRVWTGVDAVENGLIDGIGGLERSIELAAEMADIDNYRIRELPEIEDPFTAFMNQINGHMKMKILRKELGESFHLYEKLNEIREMKGTQALMPYSLEFY